MKRFGRIPQPMLDEFRRLLLETNHSIMWCAHHSGLHSRGGGIVGRIVKECRRHVRYGQWVNRKTGKLCPEVLCTSICAAEKTGLSARTVRRRIKEGDVRVARAVSAPVFAFTEKAIATLNKIGNKCIGNKWSAALSASDVRTIKRRAKQETHTAIAKDYPVSRRQISRIVDGTRWKGKP